ncbi:hypothetical protein MtrunA17_Chr1g0160591 [Medicago truncatula]|uniref:Uncharacterized protein n=1 Tax=Medicago truncatula TaxID=3880 RepID=A0A396JMT6_MEDTR|nr:hypothetical protein MtrunA17_Chr1g0160591 [Medicago truncatula]
MDILLSFSGKLDSVLSVLLILGFDTENKSVILRLLHRSRFCRFCFFPFSFSSLLPRDQCLSSSRFSDELAL